MGIQKEYYEHVKVPKKEFFLHEGAAHSPVYENGEKTSEIIDKIIQENEIK